MLLFTSNSLSTDHGHDVADGLVHVQEHKELLGGLLAGRDGLPKAEQQRERAVSHLRKADLAVGVQACQAAVPCKDVLSMSSTQLHSVTAHCASI